VSDKVAVWIQCHESVIGRIYGEVVRQNGVIQRQTKGGDLCSVLVRLPQVSMTAFAEGVAKIHASVVITPA
jgi:translation elongation factor EF-G